MNEELIEKVAGVIEPRVVGMKQARNIAKDLAAAGLLAHPELTEQTVRTCRASRWNYATPIFEGDHPSHFFSYGKDQQYKGHCAGWPKDES